MNMRLTIRDYLFPKHPLSGDLLLYDGAITTTFLDLDPTKPHEGMRFRQRISATNPLTALGRYSVGVPPHHYHPVQTEHFIVESGTMGYVVEGKEMVLRKGERLSIKPGFRHTWWVDVDRDDPEDLVVVLSAEPANGMDHAWFRNLYASSDNARVATHNRAHLAPLFHLFVLLDAGDVILADPPKPIGWILNIVLGRWIGRWIAGYRAFEDCYTYPGGKGKGREEEEEGKRA